MTNAIDLAVMALCRGDRNGANARGVDLLSCSHGDRSAVTSPALLSVAEIVPPPDVLAFRGGGSTVSQP